MAIIYSLGIFLFIKIKFTLSLFEAKLVALSWLSFEVCSNIEAVSGTTFQNGLVMPRLRLCDNANFASDRK